MKFEDRLQESAKRLMDEENSRLVVPRNPRSTKKMSWGWIATPAAAVAGILIGMSLPMMNNYDSNGAVAQSRDTIFLENDLVDTVYITKTVEKERIVKKVIVKENVQVEKSIAQTEAIDTFDIESQCTSIACDGIDYAFFRR